jgi:hypothetical protein
MGKQGLGCGVIHVTERNKICCNNSVTTRRSALMQPVRDAVSL